MEHKFSIPAIKPFVPEKLKPWIVIIFVILVQFSGGVYLSSLGEMVGTTALLQEDIMMAGYASLVGMASFFAIMFRLKCAVRPKTTLVMCGTAIIAANIACMYVTSVPLLVAICFFAGFFRMWATFECNSTIQLWLTPKRDMSVFFCFVYLLVNGVMQLSGILTIYIAALASWHYMHWMIVIFMGIILFVVKYIYRNESLMPRIPLLGIDWLGMMMWSCTALCMLFVCVYGEHYDWWQSSHIRTASAGGLILLALTLWRASFIRHPYIYLKTFSFPIVLTTIAITIAGHILIAPSHIFEHAYLEGILGYDQINMASLNWVALASVVCAVIFTWQTFAVRKWTYQRMLVIAFACFTIYLAYYYFFIDYNIPKSMLVVPIFFLNFGYVIMSVALLTALTRLPFPYHFVQGVALLNMFSASLAGAFGSAVVGRLLTVVMQRNVTLIGSTVDNVNRYINHAPAEQLYGIVQKQALMESMKEIYGWLLIVSLAYMMILMLRHSSIRPLRVIHPTYTAIYMVLRREFLARIRLGTRSR